MEDESGENNNEEFDDDNEINNENNNAGYDENGVDFILTNARSLAPKITSLIDMIHERDLTFAVVTETWFVSGKRLCAELTDIETAAGVKIIAKNRNRRLSGRGGGVCFAYRTSVSSFKEEKLKNASKFELLCVIGTAGAIKRKILVFTLYIPPKMKAADVEELTEILATGITDVKLAHGNPIIIVCGDFNGKDVKDAFAIDEAIALVKTGPTRGGSALDLVFTNALSEVTEAFTIGPLKSEDGKTSGHRCVAISTKFPMISNGSRKMPESEATRQRGVSLMTCSVSNGRMDVVDPRTNF